MNKYFKFPAESNLGIGVQYIEFNDSGWAVRQAECYEGRWFNSSKSYHEELTSSSLCDQKLTESGVKLGNPVDAQEFEDIWNLSNQVTVENENRFISKPFKNYWVGTPSSFESFLNDLSVVEERRLKNNTPKFLVSLMKFVEISKYFLGLIIESTKFAVSSIRNTSKR